MKKCEKESLYSLFKVALETIEGFRYSDAMPNFSDDVQTKVASLKCLKACH